MTIWPSFSIIIPTYQRRETVCDAVRALRDLDYEGKFDVIIVVDGSSDGTPEALRKLTSSFPLTVITQPNRGRSKARNRGALEASGDILLFLDDDMIAQQDILTEHARSCAEGADAVVGDFPVDPLSQRGFLTDSIAAAKRWERDEGAITSPFEIFSGHLSVRRSTFEKLGGFDENFTAGGAYGNEDLDFGQRLLARFRVLRNPKAIARQRHIVPPREHMRRAIDVANADLHFAAKHPELATELFNRRGHGSISRRLNLLSRVPLLPQALGWTVVGLSELALKSPLRSSRKLAHLFTATYLVRYWSKIHSLQRRAGGR